MYMFDSVLMRLRLNDKMNDALLERAIDNGRILDIVYV